MTDHPESPYLVLTQMDHGSQRPVVCGVYATIEDLKGDAPDYLGCMPFDPATDDVSLAPLIKHWSDIPDMNLYATGELMVVRDGRQTPTGLYVWEAGA